MNSNSQNEDINEFQNENELVIWIENENELENELRIRNELKMNSKLKMKMNSK